MTPTISAKTMLKKQVWELGKETLITIQKKTMKTTQQEPKLI